MKVILYAAISVDGKLAELFFSFSVFIYENNFKSSKKFFFVFNNILRPSPSVRRDKAYLKPSYLKFIIFFFV